MQGEEIVLPKTLEDGTPYVSYSQIKNWNSLKSFNLKIPGNLEYIMEYFFGEKFGDIGWAEFGQDVENYICYRDFTEEQIKELDTQVLINNKKYGKDEKLVSASLASFTEEEKKVMNTIEPLGVFQQEAIIDFGRFKLLGFLDDMKPKMEEHIRDYKSASDNSRKQYYEDDYWQLDIYGMWVKQQTKKLPKKAEVVIVERAGNCFRGGGRNVLSVKGQVWYHDRELTMDRQKYLKEYIERTVQEISDCYKVFLKLNN